MVDPIAKTELVINPAVPITAKSELTTIHNELSGFAGNKVRHEHLSTGLHRLRRAAYLSSKWRLATKRQV